VRAILVLASFASVGAAGPAAEPSAGEATPLAVGTVVEREATEGEEHRYTIELRAGQYLQAVVDQQGVDVLETITAPDGRTLLKMWGHVADIGPDPIAVVAPSTGVYGVALRAIETTEAPHRYSLRVEAVRDPTPNDHVRVEAVRAMADAERLRVEPPNDPRGELARQHDALAAWEALEDRRMQAWILLSIGAVHRGFLDQFREAADALERGLALAREVGDAPCEGKILFNLGHAEARLGEFDEGQRHLEEAVALHQASGRRDKEAYLRMALGRLLASAGQPQPALDRLYQALEIYRSLGTFARQADTEALLNLYIGEIYSGLGEHALALEHYRVAVPAQGDADKIFRARLLAARGAAYFGLEDLVEARTAYGEALAIHRTLQNSVLEAETSMLLGDVHRDEGDLRAARGLFESALGVLRSRGDAVGEAKALCRLGEILRREGDREGARRSFERALGASAVGGPLLVVCVEQGLARVAADLGDLEAARRHAERALLGAESFRAAVASQRTRAAVLAAQQSLYELLVDLRMRQHREEPSAGHDAAALEVSERSRARGLLELLAEGRIDVRESADPTLVAEERSLRQRINASALAQDEALARNRRERAEDLGREIDELAARLAEVQGRIRRADPRYADLTQPRPLNVTELRFGVLDPDTRLLEYALGATESYLWVLSPERLDSFRLAPRTEIERAARRVHELLSHPPAARRAGDVTAAARDLARLVLAPAAAVLTGKRLLVVAPGPLQYVPFAALPLPDGSHVLARYEVVSAPSASVVATLRGDASRRGAGGKTVAVFADPVFEPSDPRFARAGPWASTVAPPAARGGRPPDPLERALRGMDGTRAGVLGRLPFTGREAEAIVAFAPGERTWKAIGFDATRESAAHPRLAEYRIVHFATHAVLNAQRPELSGVVLSLLDRGGGRQDGFLRLHDVYNLRLGADLVVLSGCLTGLGKAVQGEGLVGLTRGFMHAGAPRVVASLWQVDDESTSELMKRFYRGMLVDHLPPSEALRAAQREMSSHPRWAPPFYWAGFVLQGEWRSSSAAR
jgi:CHAT domain-containing protein